jgi:2-amino-4-hydroxy-6-hydroxymethyldihydropteridine diphosphokinase
VSKVNAYVGVGSNLGKPLQQIRAAINALHHVSQSTLVKSSRLYRSKPMGPQNQPDFINAVVCLETLLTPLCLLQALQAIEQEQGRVREGERWGPRTLDLDLLLYGQQQVATPVLTIPHYGLKERPFVLYPLLDLAPTLVLPGGESVQMLVQGCGSGFIAQV